MAINKELLDQLIEGSNGELMGANGLLKQLTKGR